MKITLSPSLMAGYSMASAIGLFAIANLAGGFAVSAGVAGAGVVAVLGALPFVVTFAVVGAVLIGGALLTRIFETFSTAEDDIEKIIENPDNVPKITGRAIHETNPFAPPPKAPPPSQPLHESNPFAPPPKTTLPAATVAKPKPAETKQPSAPKTPIHKTVEKGLEFASTTVGKITSAAVTTAFVATSLYAGIAQGPHNDNIFCIATPQGVSRYNLDSSKFDQYDYTIGTCKTPETIIEDLNTLGGEDDARTSMCELYMSNYTSVYIKTEKYDGEEWLILGNFTDFRALNKRVFNDTCSSIDSRMHID